MAGTEKELREEIKLLEQAMKNLRRAVDEGKEKEINSARKTLNASQQAVAVINKQREALESLVKSEKTAKETLSGPKGIAEKVLGLTVSLGRFDKKILYAIERTRVFDEQGQFTGEYEKVNFFEKERRLQKYNEIKNTINLNRALKAATTSLSIFFINSIMKSGERLEALAQTSARYGVTLNSLQNNNLGNSNLSIDALIEVLSLSLSKGLNPYSKSVQTLAKTTIALGLNFDLYADVARQLAVGTRLSNDKAVTLTSQMIALGNIYGVSSDKLVAALNSLQSDLRRVGLVGGPGQSAAWGAVAGQLAAQLGAGYEESTARLIQEFNSAKFSGFIKSAMLGVNTEGLSSNDPRQILMTLEELSRAATGIQNQFTSGGGAMAALGLGIVEGLFGDSELLRVMQEISSRQGTLSIISADVLEQVRRQQELAAIQGSFNQTMNKLTTEIHGGIIKGVTPFIKKLHEFVTKNGEAVKNFTFNIMTTMFKVASIFGKILPYLIGIKAVLMTSKMLLTLIQLQGLRKEARGVVGSILGGGLLLTGVGAIAATAIALGAQALLSKTWVGGAGSTLSELSDTMLSTSKDDLEIQEEQNRLLGSISTSTKELADAQLGRGISNSILETGILSTELQYRMVELLEEQEKNRDLRFMMNRLAVGRQVDIVED